MTVSTRRGDRCALVMMPLERVLVGRDRLELLREGSTLSRADQAIIDRVQHSRGRYDVFVFSGTSADGSARYGFDDRLPRDSLEDLARLLVRSRLRCWRSLLEAGVALVVHSDFGLAASLCRQACRELAGDPNRIPGLATRVAAIDEWILRNASFFFSQKHEATMTTRLPDMLPLVESRRDKMDKFAQVLREESW